MTATSAAMTHDGLSMSDTPERFPFQWTLGGIQRINLELEAACRTPDCGWFYSFNVEELIEQVGPDSRLPPSGAGIPCRECGGTLKFQVAHLHPAPDDKQT